MFHSLFQRLDPRPEALALLLALTSIPGAAWAADTPNPATVTVAGSLQSELGCAGDWQPDCAATRLAFDAEDDVWQGTFAVPAGDFEYKAALNNGWDENYGANAVRGGGNIPLTGDGGNVKFYYSHETHWITSDKNSIIAVAPGSFQSELGCSGDWQPDCLRSWLQDPDGDGIFTFSTRSLPAGSYEVKVALDESWDVNYGADGVQGGANIPFAVTSDCAVVTFSWNSTTKVLTVSEGGGGTVQPASVTIPGSFQQELGCSGDWQAECAVTHLDFDSTDGVWQKTFDLPAGSWEYKAALNDSWTENYGQNATRDGANLQLTLADAAPVKFYYSRDTNWVTSNRNSVIATVPGSYQHFLGCSGDWQPDCLRSWLQDPDGDGVYSFSTRAIPAGTYEAKVAIDESWDINYGEGGAQNGANISFTVPATCGEVFFQYDSGTHVLSIGAQGTPRGNLNRARAHWVSADTIAWNPGPVQPGWTVELYTAPEGGLTLSGTGIDGGSGGTVIPLTYDPAGLPADVTAKFPHLSALSAFRIPTSRLAEVPAALKGQLAVSAKAADGSVIDATSLQIPGVLDDLYTYDGALGATFQGRVPTIRLWAPTARSVKLLLFADSNPATVAQTFPMTGDPATGVWRVTGASSWYGKYYLYEVEVFVRSTGRVETNRVTDPYSVSLSKNSQRSQVLDLSDPAWRPLGWSLLGLLKPRLDAPEDIVIYELHVRDFSAQDATVPAAERGTFEAFTRKSSNGMKHLSALAKAGLTHVHLLPAFDIATIDEDKSTWQSPAGNLASFPPDSEEQQARVSAVADADGFNWGYDPWHYSVPEGSYSTHPDGPRRVLEFREMVKSLNESGLRVVMDVVYNHTNSAGQNDKSVLDRIVPGYYHRLNADGNVENSTCCSNTATEHNMMEKLMVDSVVLWAREYKVDGFRFDLMGHHMKRNMLAVRAALDALTLARDGVDGKKVYVYGEGWNFGEVANDARGVQATQANVAGTGLGTFSDRLRDGVRGGGPFSGLQEQGFATGLWYEPNGVTSGSSQDQRDRLLQYSDWVRVGMAGNLAAYQLEDRNGNLVSASQIDYNGQPAGYTEDPSEVITYIDAHDNETLFDTVQMKMSLANPMADRVRANNLGMSIVMLGQGIPFFHAGADLLRSKSLDRNSYNSGDWFNKLDFTYQSNNWGVGLPPARDNQSSWPVMRPLLANPALEASSADIRRAAEHFREMLAVRKSTRLFRLRTAADVQSRLRYYNTGPSQIPGLIVAAVTDTDGRVDRRYDRAVAVVNATPESQSYRVAEFQGTRLALHKVLANSTDPVVRTSTFNRNTGTFTVPGRTAAVFWSERPLAEQFNLLIADVRALVAAGLLSDLRGNSLENDLEAAREAAGRGQTLTAILRLDVFLLRLGVFALAGQLPAENALELAEEGAALIARLRG